LAAHRAGRLPRQPWAKRRFSGIKRSCHASQLLVITADGSSLAATEHGRQTRERIVRATAGLIADHGPAETSLDDVREAIGTSKSQLYHYFGDKHGLVEAWSTISARPCSACKPKHSRP
jgi:hypothetical protein